MSRAELADRDRVVITGYGVVTALGPDVETTYAALRRGENAIRPITETRLADYTQFHTQMGAPILDFDLFAERFSSIPRFSSLKPKDLLRIHCSAQYVLWASMEAQSQAGILDANLQLDQSKFDRKKAGIRIGTSIGGGEEVGNVRQTIDAKGDVKGKRLGGQPILQILPERVATVPSMAYKYEGPVATGIAACATSLENIINAAEILTHSKRRAHVMLAGGTDAVLTATGISIFEGVGATSSSSDPSMASRPLHRAADGLVMGEGCGVMVLETLESAKQRDVEVLAEISGWAESSDAFRDTEPNGEGAEYAMREALIDAGVDRKDLVSLDGHFTGTPLGDAVEMKAISRVFNSQEVNGHSFYRDQVVAITSRKSAIGHTLAASGAIETIMAVRARQDNEILPSLWLDEEVQIDESRGWPVVIKPGMVVVGGFKILKSNFGFGGLNASLLLEKPAY